MSLNVVWRNPVFSSDHFIEANVLLFPISADENTISSMSSFRCSKRSLSTVNEKKLSFVRRAMFTCFSQLFAGIHNYDTGFFYPILTLSSSQRICFTFGLNCSRLISLRSHFKSVHYLPRAMVKFKMLFDVFPAGLSHVTA